MYLPSINAGDFYEEGPDRLHRIAGAAVGVNADTMQKAFSSYADVAGAETAAMLELVKSQLRNPQQQQKSGALEAFELGTSLLGGAINSGMGSGSEPFGYDDVVEGPLLENPLDSFEGLDIEGPIYDFTDPSFTGL